MVIIADLLDDNIHMVIIVIMVLWLHRLYGCHSQAVEWHPINMAIIAIIFILLHTLNGNHWMIISTWSSLPSYLYYYLLNLHVRHSWAFWRHLTYIDIIAIIYLYSHLISKSIYGHNTELLDNIHYMVIMAIIAIWLHTSLGHHS